MSECRNKGADGTCRLPECAPDYVEYCVEAPCPNYVDIAKPNELKEFVRSLQLYQARKNQKVRAWECLLDLLALIDAEIARQTPKVTQIEPAQHKPIVVDKEEAAKWQTMRSDEVWG